MTEVDLTYQENLILENSLHITNRKRQYAFFSAVGFIFFMIELNYHAYHNIVNVFLSILPLLFTAYLTRPINITQIKTIYINSVNAGLRARV